PRPDRHERAGRHCLADGPRLLQRALLRRHRAGRPVLAPRRSDLDLPLPAHLPDLGGFAALPENGEHHSALPYFLVWVALLILTVTTYLTGRMHLATW